MATSNSVQAPGLLRAVGAGSVLYGALLLSAPRVVVAAVGGGRTPPPSLVVRVLGARQIGQGAALLLRPARATVVLSSAVDGMHALTMAAAALRWPAYRRVSVASGAVALLSGVLATVAVA